MSGWSRRSRRWRATSPSMCRRPNTPGLRDLQRGQSLDDLLARVIEARDRMCARAGPTPLLLKIAPDLSLADLDDIVGVARAPQGRRHDRRQHHGRPAAVAARSRHGERAGRIVRQAAVSAVDADAGGDLCAGRRRVPADRRRRHRFRRGRARQDQGRRRAWCSSTAALVFHGLGAVDEIKRARCVAALDASAKRERSWPIWSASNAADDHRGSLGRRDWARRSITAPSARSPAA